MIVSSKNLDISKKTSKKKKVLKSVETEILEENILKNEIGDFKEMYIEDLEAIETIEEGEKLRPAKLSEYIGQEQIKRQLQIIIDSSKIREKLPEHILFYGQPGLGKTTLSNLISKELKANFKVVSAPALQRIGDIVSLLLNLEGNTVLFIDEIHRLKAPLEETLYTAMEDFQVDLVMGKGAGAQSSRLDLPTFVLVGATTQLGKLSKPLKDRFPTIFNLQPYSENEILEIIERNCKILKLRLDDEAKVFVCLRSRGVPRITNNLLKRILDYSLVHKIKVVDKFEADRILQELGIFDKGLTKQDFTYLKALEDGSVSLKTMSGILLEETETIEQVIEPYLLYLGFIDKTSEGRRLTSKGRSYINREEEGLFI